MDIKVPRLGEGAESGFVVSILVKVGDEIKAGQTIIELENEKAVAPIPANASGKVTKIYVKEGDKISVGQPILALEDQEAAAAAAIPAPAAEPPARLQPPAARAETAPTFQPAIPVAASPTIRKLARDLGIDLAQVPGSERGGRIVLADLRAYIQRLQRAAIAPATAAEPAKTVTEPLDFSQWGPIVKKPMSSLRRIIAQRMHESWSSVPRVTQFDEADITTLMALRKKYAARYEKKGAHLTLTPFLLKAAVAALKKHPIFNASLDEVSNEIVLKQYYHIGVAVETEHGLIVPVIRDVDKKSLLELSRELNELAEKTRQRKLSPDELKGGTFTISNQGGIGGAHFTPIVNKPEVAILGVGRGALKPVVRAGKIQKRTMLPLGLSYDHRLIDGADAARFIVQIVQALENFKDSDVKI